MKKMSLLVCAFCLCFAFESAHINKGFLYIRAGGSSSPSDRDPAAFLGFGWRSKRFMDLFSLDICSQLGGYISYQEHVIESYLPRVSLLYYISGKSSSSVFLGLGSANGKIVPQAYYFSDTNKIEDKRLVFTPRSFIGDVVVLILGYQPDLDSRVLQSFQLEVNIPATPEAQVFTNRNNGTFNLSYSVGY